MNATHYHRVKQGLRVGAYESATAAAMDASERGGTWVACNCDHGADEIARRNEGHRLALATPREDRQP